MSWNRRKCGADVKQSPFGSTAASRRSSVRDTFLHGRSRLHFVRTWHLPGELRWRYVWAIVLKTLSELTRRIGRQSARMQHVVSVPPHSAPQGAFLTHRDGDAVAIVSVLPAHHHGVHAHSTATVRERRRNSGHGTHRHGATTAASDFPGLDQPRVPVVRALSTRRMPGVGGQAW